MRISDADRKRAVTDLTRHCGDGRLTLDELEDRIDEVHAATTDVELGHAFRELPPFRLEPKPKPSPEDTRPAQRTGPRPAGRCGVGMVGVPPCILVPLIILLFVTWHVFVASMVLLFVVVPRRVHRAVARA